MGCICLSVGYLNRRQISSSGTSVLKLPGVNKVVLVAALHAAEFSDLMTPRRRMKQRTSVLLLVPAVLAAVTVFVGVVDLARCDSTLWSLVPSDHKPCLID